MGQEQVEQILEQAVAGGAVPGAVAIAVDRDGVVAHAAAGALEVGGQTPVQADTVFRIASMTKALATVAVLQLAEQGRLDLDAEVRSILPEFGELQVLEGFDGDTPRLRPPATQATVRQLLNHTAGCSYWFTNADLLRWHDITQTPDVFSFSKAYLKAPLVADPGTRWEYGTNTDWAGLVVEAVSGQTLGAYLREHLFEPLGMRETSFRRSPEQVQRTMPLHSRTDDGGLVANGIEYPDEPEFEPGGHGAYSTAGDYGRFLRMLLRGGELDGARVLKEETVDLAFSPSIGDIQLPELIRSARPDLTNDIPALPVPSTWGLGFQLVLADIPDLRRAGSGSWAGLANCYFWVDRASGVAGAWLTQVLPFFDEPIVNAALTFEGAVYAARGAAVPAAS
ncbi:MAG TPA: serine hydrolase domain-containing protein [Baekduia sp.]|nr:serine hydrolase domain-containing protein [Baekduia sp.]